MYKIGLYKYVYLFIFKFFYAALSVLLSSLLQTRGMIAASKYVHSFMLTHTLQAPLKFFDSTPVGRIVNRFGKDIDTIDNTLPQIIRSWLTCFFGVTNIKKSVIRFPRNLGGILACASFTLSVI